MPVFCRELKWFCSESTESYSSKSLLGSEGRVFFLLGHA